DDGAAWSGRCAHGRRRLSHSHCPGGKLTVVLTIEKPLAVESAEPRPPRRLIPLEVLFGNPERLNPQISPDGTRLAYAAPDARGVLQIWVGAVAATFDRAPRAVTYDQKRG